MEPKKIVFQVVSGIGLSFHVLYLVLWENFQKQKNKKNLHIFSPRVLFFFEWPKINAYDPLGVPLLETDDCTSISCDSEIMQTFNRNKSCIEEEYVFHIRNSEQYEKEMKFALR